MRPAARLMAIALCAVAADALLAPALAQSSLETRAVIASDPPRSRTSPATGLPTGYKPNPDAKMLVQANEMVHDYQRDQVSAVGQVQIYYDGAVLEADRVTYDRRNAKLYASGNVRFRDKEGNVAHTDSLELTEDFRDGFIQSLLVETPERTRFAASSARRTEGNLTVFDRGIYTACEPCKEDPTKPPLWQVKAARIVHNEGEKVVYYEDATIEFFGVPIAYFPAFWHPDPTVKRQSGFLAPTFFSNSRTGTGVNIPYFWALAPNYDVTLSVAPMTEQIGPLVTGEFRHRLATGAYTIRAAGIFQQDPDEFINSSGASPGVRDFRGSLQSTGQFRINRKWNWGWDATLLTDRAFLHDYPVEGQIGGAEKISQVYLTGQGDRSYFDMRGMGFIGFSREDHNDQLPFIHPVLDYSYVLGRPVLGGELAVTANLISLSRREVDFDKIASDADCITDPNPNNCMLRGIQGDYTRGTAQMDWRRTLINPWGMVFKPFASMRADLAWRDIDPTGGTERFYEPGSETLYRAMPTAGMEVRWPFISVHSWGTQVVEPIGQIIVRPNEQKIGEFPNEDAQSLVFDDTNLFSIDKYSGYDRVEGGTRANVGVQYTANIHGYGMVNALFGQSYHLAGRNSFEYSGFENDDGRQTGLGLESGLESDVSDYVGRLYYQPVSNLSFTARGRFDRKTFDVSRFELEARSQWEYLSLATIYARYEAQPLIGYTDRREAVYQTGALKMNENWGLFGGVRYDLDRDKIDMAMAGINYIDECFAMTFSYIADYTNLVATKPIHRVMLRMNLRTIGGTGFSTQIGSERVQ